MPHGVGIIMPPCKARSANERSECLRLPPSQSASFANSVRQVGAKSAQKKVKSWLHELHPELAE